MIKNEAVMSYMKSIKVFSILFTGLILAGKGGVVYAQNAANQGTVKGIVTDANTSKVLPAVNISVQGTTVGTTTGSDGKYSFTVPSLQDTLRFSYIGYKQKVVPIRGRTSINVKLVPQTIQGKGTVVTAYGEEVSKQNLIGSVTTVGPAAMKSMRTAPTSNLTTSLAGQVAGLIAYQRSGEPGSDNADFFIRGVSTFGYKKNPLILIDNIESTTRDLARLNPSDIESFSILKDATATSLYGSRAANGVILIKTKKGFQQEAHVNLRVARSVSMPTENIDLADPVQYMKLNNRAVQTRNPLAVTPYSNRKIDNTEEGVNPIVYPAINWRKELLKNYATTQRVHLDVRGGGDVARYYVSGAFSQDNGLLKVDPINNFNNNINLKNYSLRSNVNIDLSSTTELAVKLHGSFDDYNGPVHGGAHIYREIMETSPVRFPPVYPKTEGFKYVNHPLFGNYESGAGGYMNNPYAEMVKGYRHYSRNIVSTQFKVKQDLSFIAQGLKISGMVNTRRNSYYTLNRAYNPYWYHANSYNRRENTYKLSLLNEQEGTDYLSYNPGDKTISTSFYTLEKLNYNHTFFGNHNFSGMVIFTARNDNTGNPSDLKTSLPRRNVNLAGRATYNYDHRYYGQVNIAYNGSERFAKRHRFGFFPSYGVAWNISNEAFWGGLKSVVDNLRIHATYGFSGNSAIGSPSDRFLYLSNVNLNDPDRGATFGEDNGYQLNGVSISRYSNPRVTWEKSKKLNLALNIGLFDKLDFEVEYFKEHRSRILMTRHSMTASMGLSAIPQANIGEAQNKGTDMSLEYSQTFGNTGFLKVRGNFTYSHSKYLQYSEYKYKDEPWKSHIGNSISQNYGYIAERLFVDDNEANNSPPQFGEYGGGDIKYHDVSGDGKITQLDQVPIGDPTKPELVYGFGFSGGVKNFDLSAFFQGAGNESFWIDADATAPFVDNKQLLKAYANNHWSRENQNLNALWPRLSASSTGNHNNTTLNTWFMRNGSFLRLKKVEAGYTLPKTIQRKLSLSNLRIYVNARNLFTWSKFDLWDPEMGGNGLGYPIQRVFNLGINVSFIGL